MIKKESKKGFTLVELLAVIVILSVVILIAVTAVIPRMNNAKKKALVDEALIYLNAAKEAYSFDPELVNASSCTNITDLNGKYVKKDSDQYKGAVKTTINDGVVSQTIYLTDGKYYVSGTDNVSPSNVVDEKPLDFLNSCGDYNPILADNANTNTLSYKLIMNEGGTTFNDNLSIIEEKTANVVYNTSSYTSSNSGLHKAADDYGGSFYYRGDINNNWLEFAGFYWRILRINGDGTIRIMYSGLKNSTHTGNDALIVNSLNEITSKYSTDVIANKLVDDVSGLSQQKISTQFAPFSYVGYMYDTSRTVQLADVSNDTLSSLWGTTQLSSTSNMYLFKNFNNQTDCNTSGDSIACTLTCRNLGDDCINVNWNNIIQSSEYISEDAEYEGSEWKPAYISPYKYTCNTNSYPVLRNNSDGTTSVYISCTSVIKILGIDPYSSNSAYLISYNYLVHPSMDNVNNVKESNLKKEIDLWYTANIFNRKDDTNHNYLEDYLADEVFCNDRSIYEKYNGQYFDIYYRLNVQSGSPMNPSFKCKNIKNDGFTLESTTQSLVEQSNIGNNKLKFPVGTVTGDELEYACLRQSYKTTNCYLNNESSFWTMSPSTLSASGGYIVTLDKTSSKTVVKNGKVDSLNGIKPVINLRADILYDSGSGTEADPYKVKLPTT